MQRLTKPGITYNFPKLDIAEIRYLEKIQKRLSSYEDTGLEPDVCSNYRKFEDEAISKGVTFKRIVELMNAEHDGRLVVLPCKVGDDVWFVRKFGNGQCIKRAKVSCINIDFRGEVFVSARRISGGYIGKTVFLTREEAEAVLAGKGGDR